MIKKIIKFVFGMEEGRPCYVLAQEAGDINIRRGRIMLNTGKSEVKTLEKFLECEYALIPDSCKTVARANEMPAGLDIRYRWIGNTGHAFTAFETDIIGTHKGKPLFSHEVGSLFAGNTTSPYSSELLHEIFESNIAKKALKGLEEIEEEEAGGFPWKKILIYGGIAALLIYLNQSGVLQQILPKSLFGG